MVLLTTQQGGAPEGGKWMRTLSSGSRIGQQVRSTTHQVWVDRQSTRGRTMRCGQPPGQLRQSAGARGICSAPTSVPQESQQSTLREFIDKLPGKWEPRDSNFPSAMSFAVLAIHRGTLITCSDGSHMAERCPGCGAATWTMCDLAAVSESLCHCPGCIGHEERGQCMQIKTAGNTCRTPRITLNLLIS